MEGERTERVGGKGSGGRSGRGNNTGDSTVYLSYKSTAVLIQVAGM